MPNEPKGNVIPESETEEEVSDRVEKDEPCSGSEGSYYYDDAHGYEDFDPDSEDGDDETEI